MGYKIFQEELQMTNTLHTKVIINNKFCRSVNINNDYNDIELLKTIICPNSFKLIIENMLDNVYSTGQTAFTWTGPYGAGKSSLALLLTALLGKNKRKRDIAETIVGSTFKKKIFTKLKINKGWKVLPIVCELDSIENIIRKKIENDINDSVNNILNNITEYLKKNEGLLIILDEMGKSLEASAKKSHDIYIYQQLAEFASRTNGRFIIIGILHQSFGDYAWHLPYSVRDEWIKVQGRYVDIPINTASEEQIELITRAIRSERHSNAFISEVAKKTVECIARNKKVVSEKILIEKLINCWPINPVVIILLCQLSKKRFGQNQRSIFSFLSSGEPLAFRDFIFNTKYNEKTLYMPTDFFDYVRINLESSILSSSESRLWHTAIEAINKCQARGFSDMHLNILKTIAIIDLFNGSSGVTSNIDVLTTIFLEIDVNKILEDLKKLSVIIFKKHSNAYSIYEGSDFDIDNAIEEAYSNENYFNIEKLSDIANFKPIIAKRFYHKFGSLRWFDIIIAPTEDCYYFLNKEKEKTNADGLFVILLPSTEEDINDAYQIINNSGIVDFPVVFTIAENTRIIKEYLQELLALEWIQNNKNELAGDSIARKEVDDRKQLLKSYLENQLNKILVESKWYFNAEEINMKLNELSIRVSEICENIYKDTPIIKSELLNREKPSGNANAALYALLRDMVLFKNTEDLGIDGFTPEKGLYNILLKDTGIHKKEKEGNYIFSVPKKNNLKALWEFTDQYLRTGKTTIILDIFEEWKKKPFGVKSGLFPFLIAAYIMTRNNIIAVYRDGIYNPEITDFLIEHLYTNPKTISIKYIKSDIIAHDLINNIIMAINEITKDNELTIDTEPLNIAKKLVSLIDSLHPWVLKTKTLTKKTIQLREIIKTSNDPNKLLFEDISKIFTSNELYEGLKSCMNELLQVYPSMLQSVGILLTSELDIPLVTPSQIEKLNQRAKNIKGVAGDFQIDAFAARLSTFNSNNNDIAGIISLANSKPQKDWIDLDIENAKKEIIRLCIDFKKAELFTKIKNRSPARQAIAFISGIGGKSEIITGEFSLLVDKRDEVERSKQKIKQLFKSENDIALILTALAETSIDYLRGKHEQ
jgi:hypothetical protein